MSEMRRGRLGWIGKLSGRMEAHGYEKAGEVWSASIRTAWINRMHEFDLENEAGVLRRGARMSFHAQAILPFFKLRPPYA
jgi:hypothetical protein